MKIYKNNNKEILESWSTILNLRKNLDQKDKKQNYLCQIYGKYQPLSIPV